MPTLAGQRAQFTWALRQNNLAEDAEKQAFYARRMAKYVASALANGFTIHAILAYRGTKIAAAGQEWFKVSREQVIAIYRSIAESPT